jgi:hypothetical protein
MLSRSTLDPELSGTASVFGGYNQSPVGPSHGNLTSLADNDPDELQRRAEQTQYLWLQRYHAHMAKQRVGDQAANCQSVYEETKVT